MADIKLNINGRNEAKGAIDEAKHGLESLGEMSEKVQEEMAHKIGLSVAAWDELKEGIKKGLEMLVEFTKESVKAYAEQERIDRQLEMVAGSLAEAYKKQAEELEKSVGIDTVKTERMQMMLYQFGVAPGKINETVEALIDYSSRMGVDAVEATQHLTMSVDSGKNAFKGITTAIESTGDKSKDVMLYVDQLKEKMGGAAEEDAKGLGGRVHAVGVEFENLQKKFGAFIDDVDRRYGVLDKLKTALSNIAAPDSQKVNLLTGAVGHSYDPITGEDLGAIPTFPELGGAPAPPLNMPGSTTNPNAGQTSKAKSGAAAEALKYQTALDAANKRTHEDWKKDEELQMAIEEDDHKRRMQLLGDEVKAQGDAVKKEMKYEEDLMSKRAEEFTTWDQAVKKSEDNAIKMQETWKSATEAIGASIVTNIAGAIQSMMEGGKFDAKRMMGSILQSILSIVGNVLLPGFGGQIGGALGGLLSAGVNTMHDGGWVDGIPRHHSGVLAQDEHVAILQQGERVLSRAEVASMGGPGGVDGRASGNAVNVSVQTIDAESSRSYFERRGGRAIFNAVRTGRGQLRPLFGM